MLQPNKIFINSNKSQRQPGKNIFHPPYFDSNNIIKLFVRFSIPLRILYHSENTWGIYHLNNFLIYFTIRHSRMY